MYNNYNLHLSHPIEIADGQGGFKQGEVLEVKAPSMENYNYIANLKGFVGKAMANMSSMATEGQKAQTPSNDEKMDGSTARMLLQMSGVYSEASQEFMKFLTVNSYIDGIQEGVKVTDSILKKMDIKDFEQCLGEYFADFLFEV